MSTETLIAGFVVSTVGFSVFLYGKRQTRLPQVVAGMLLLVIPFVIPNPWWMSCAAVGLLAGMTVAIRRNL